MTIDRRLFTLSAAALVGAAAFNPRLAFAADRTLIIALPNNPATLDPMQNSNHDAMAMTGLIYENLLEVGPDGSIMPALAHSMPKVSDDQLVFTFDLRDDVVFQNGQKFSAEDVKYSYDYILDPKNKSARRTLYGPIQEITIESPTRVVFKMKTPFRPWLQYMSKFMGVFPKGSREAKGDDYFKTNPVGMGTGPGTLVEWRPNDQIEVARNPNYWRKGVPAWDRVIAKIVPEDAARVAYLQTGQAHIISPAPREFARLAKEPGIKTGSATATGAPWFIQTNNRRAPFDDVNFRKAVACAIDRKKIAEEVLYGYISPAATPAAPGTSYFNEEANAALSYDVEKAKAYLAKSKYPNGAEFEMLIPAQPYLFDSRDAAVVIQSQLAAIGIKMRITPMELPQILTRDIGGTQQASLLPLMAPQDPTFVIQITYTPDQLMTKSSGYNNPELNAAMAESYKHLDPQTLDPILKKIQAILVEDSPNIWLGFVVVANAWRDEVKNFKPSTGLSMALRDVSLA